MSKKLAIGLGAAALVLIFGISILGWVIGFNNECIRQEKGIEAQYKQNQNKYDNMVKAIREVAQIPEMYADDLKKVFTAAIQGRYGQDGAKATWQWIQEQNPQVDASIYKQVQQVIESGRREFEADQKGLIDKKRVYETYFQQFPASTLAGIMGFPRIDLAKFDIVTSAETDKAFQTKQADPIQIRPKAAVKG